MAEADAEQPKDDAASDKPKVHTATLSEPKADPGAQPGKDGKPKKEKKKKKERPEPTTPLGKLWYNWVKPIGSVIVLVVVFRSMLLDWNDVPTGSMEPEIQVGDRIAVNRLSYGLQFPLTGPQIGIPFTPVQFDNPLDGIPQINWGSGPQRGDIVTFWNPVTDVRMVKRIVAVPGDTIEVRNSAMTINGTAATYADVTPSSAGLSPVTKYKEQDPRTGVIKSVSKPVLYRSETLDDSKKITQHIKERWINYAFVGKPDGTVQTIDRKDITVKVAKPSAFDPRVTVTQNQKITVDEYMQQNPGFTMLARVKDGELFVAGEAASYNEFAEFVLQRYETGTVANLLDKIGLGVDGHHFIVDGENVFSEQFRTALEDRFDQLTGNEQTAVRSEFIGDLSLLRSVLTTNFGPYTVPEDGYLMIGDNRNNSSDGRYFGPVQRSEITGRAFGVAFSFTENKMFALPPDPAWDRFFIGLD